ncbi:hypothetical protein U14_02549 [Candidatus Moduliflexus flocculans]|uniref:Uncharacterized protein n=1 Tax=Candidatus Moduliflexus flocculans TaxID=1499966 RepID=A0A081BLP0_9BACT|nr:hypothetical protein U14_02549 [Candidatus Moduliflexus flocculans]
MRFTLFDSLHNEPLFQRAFSRCPTDDGEPDLKQTNFPLAFVFERFGIGSVEIENLAA